METKENEKEESKQEQKSYNYRITALVLTY
jgi:hypothetical protein